MHFFGSPEFFDLSRVYMRFSWWYIGGLVCCLRICGYLEFERVVGWRGCEGKRNEL